MNIKLDKKILTGFIFCSAILLSVAIISFKNSEQIVSTNQWVNHTHQVLHEFDQILVSSVNAETGARGFVITGDENYLDPYTTSRQELRTHIFNAGQLTLDNPAQQGNIATIERLLDSRLKHIEQCIELRTTSGFEEAAALVRNGEGKRLQTEISRVVGEAKEIEQRLLVNRERESELYTRYFNFMFITLLVVIVTVLATVFIIISTNLKALRKSEKETAEKNWSLEGSGDLIRNTLGNLQLTELAQTIISHLTPYLHAHLGALYIAENDGIIFKLVSTYVVESKNENFSVIQFGQGIVGQAAAEKRMILITDISSDFFTIDAVFGKVEPKNILAFPFVIANKVVGVVVLGSIYDFNKLQKEYLAIVGDSIAIAIESAQIRLKTKDLLEETQRQAEELQAQQLELRQTNEELYAKTELLEKSEFKLKAQQEELQQSNEELEKKADLLADQKRDLENAKIEIENKAHEVEVTNKYKSEFLANMSHELRTPLNSILILAQLLSENKSKKLGEKESEFARNIYSSGTDLLHLINEILDLSKIESGKMQLEIANVPISEIANDMSAMFSQVAKAKSIDFRIIVEEKSVPPLLKTDRQLLGQILRNLLSNAFKFTGNGGQVLLMIEMKKVEASSKTKVPSATENLVAFSISDSGIGIPKEKQEIVFEAFQQADGSTKRKYGGTGLGLSISRELTHALGGEIYLKSEEGKGSTFTLFLPVEFDPSIITPTHKMMEIREKIELKTENPYLIGSHKQIHSANAVEDDRDNITPSDRVILIIEDDQRFATVLLDFVRERNYKGIVAHQGSTGISYARHYRPDAILLDMKLPVMDGEKVLKQIKNDPDLRHIPVQVISAYDDHQKGFDLGAFDFIKKPVTTNDLHKAFERIENFSSKKLKKLLIIEDNEQQNTAIRELIGNGDVKCSQAYQGTQAYEMLCNEAFDCIIVDLGLPDMSGFELLEKIKADAALNRIPIIVYTGKDLKKDENARLDKLASTVVLKTLNSQERLLDETILFLHRVESKLPKEKQAIIRKLHRTDEVLMYKRVLIVDDDIRNIYSLTNALEEAGVQCITAENGKEALRILKEDSNIDIVLMDIMMPEMDGYEATIEIRKSDELKKLPIIALTAKAMKGDKEKCLAVGMSDYISKPVNIEQLLSLMQVWLYR